MEERVETIKAMTVLVRLSDDKVYQVIIEKNKTKELFLAIESICDGFNVYDEPFI